MSLTNIALLGILLGFVFLVVGFLMEGPQMQTEPNWGKGKQLARKNKKRVIRSAGHRRAA